MLDDPHSSLFIYIYFGYTIYPLIFDLQHGFLRTAPISEKKTKAEPFFFPNRIESIKH